jgi:hypothetical protein
VARYCASHTHAWERKGRLGAVEREGRTSAEIEKRGEKSKYTQQRWNERDE